MKPIRRQPELRRAGVRRCGGGGGSTSRSMARAKPRRPAPSKQKQAPLWETLLAVAPFLDAVSLAAASCVSTSWRAAFADDALWARLCRAHYPSALGLLPQLTPESDNGEAGRHLAPHRRLFALFHAAATRRRAPPAPRLSLANVTFAVDLFLTAEGENAVSFAVAASEAGVRRSSSAGVFHFAVDLSGRAAVVGPGEHWRVRWTAVRTGLGLVPAAVVMMDAKVPAARAGVLGCGARGMTWTTERLRSPSCGGAKLDAEVVMEVIGDGEERLVEKMRFGVLLDCSYVSIDMGLRYLQDYLL